jgi:hypothetical protein
VEERNETHVWRDVEDWRCSVAIGKAANAGRTEPSSPTMWWLDENQSYFRGIQLFFCIFGIEW